MSATQLTSSEITTHPRQKTASLIVFAVGIVIAIVSALTLPHAGLLGLVPIVMYSVLTLMNTDVVLATVASLLVAVIMTRTGPIALGTQMATSLGSFVAVIGMIIMLGAGLGRVAQDTGAAERLVRFVMDKVGLKTPTRVQTGLMIASLILVASLGTLAGANAVLAPIVIPIAGRAKWKPPAVAAMFHSAGAAGLMVGPFTPPVVAIMGVTHLTYGTYLLHAGLPIAALTFVTGFIMSRIIQRLATQQYTEADLNLGDQDKPTNKHAGFAACAMFVVLFGLTIFGVFVHADYTFALIVMICTAAAVGLAGRMAPKDVVGAVYQGASKLIWLFFLFWLLDPMLTLIGKTGAYDAAFHGLKPFLSTAGPFVFLLLLMLLGFLHTIPGAAAAQVVLVNKIFGGLAVTLGIPMGSWALLMLAIAQVDQLGPTPGADMIGQMGLARSDSVKYMLYNGWGIMATNSILIIVIFFFTTLHIH
ncbi:SLC13 family permease [Spelaeicoccus albus]|uniref:Di/tricarboxylate transporter n=1 Tax=Spelaeicoccus albus TaxID=1280376 RepID=A0A7Z0D076_9MICO|nr:SLC13 family permease [Spelaeicoccus albus]NYI67061.1 di/tricarboxylate transporter [Spelaeicoccus albus]